MADAKQTIENGKAVLGIEFGSTRIKAVLIDEEHNPIATGAHDWENQLVDGIWTYSLDMIWNGIQDCYTKMADDAKKKASDDFLTYVTSDDAKKIFDSYYFDTNVE